MNGFNQIENGPGRLADSLAELLQRFRHFSGTMEPVLGLASDLARIRISGRLLAALGHPSGPATEGFARLGGVLREWVNRFESVPESFPVHLALPVAHLADFLEELLVRRDEGVPSAELAMDAGWVAVLAAFRNAGTPLAVLEEVDDLFRKWGTRWTDATLTPVQEKQLRRRWLSLRSKGDALFRGDERREAWSGDSGVRPLVLLLVDSNFRRDQIREKLTARDYRVEIPHDPDQALEFLATGQAPRAVLCDNLEPTLHLTRLRRGMAGLGAVPDIPLILVMSNPLAAEANAERALALGAVAAWSEPFDAADLNRILQRLSQP